MDPTFILSAVIFTLLALVVATSLLNGGQDPLNARGYPGHGEASAAKQNGHLPDTKQSKKKAVDDWCELSGSSHDHWDVVKSVQSEEVPPVPASGEPAPLAAERSSSSASSLSVPRPDSRHTSFDSSSEASSGRGRRSYIGLSDQELLKCAFSHPQTEGAAESPEVNDKTVFNANNSFQYVPGKSRSQHMEMMMSKEELEEEQRVQREQLAAIFQLLRDNTETFGEVSEGDMEEQLRLYSI
uniref:matrix-remodeling-associated protein 7-like isoform X2 n=1 Tax=Doryrhamphus excisus TaxID=161450 RepID=UPI0025ADAEA5|nr:matrix-remodeling-associated protein 7-like isoform X2 [Doryrhamphus excisus]